MSKQKEFLISVFAFFSILLFVFVVLLMIHVKKTDSVFLVDDLSCYYKEEVYVNQFIRDIDGELLDNYLVDTSIVGKRTLEIQFKNRYGFVEKKKFDVSVKDNVSPFILVDDVYTVHEGEISNLLDSIVCADDYDDGIKCNIFGEYDLLHVGQYPLEIEASDKSGNVTRKKFVLNVVGKNENDVSHTSTDFKDVYQRYKSNDTEIGVDISKWQGDVDFEKLSNSGVSFVMLKIGGQSEIGGDIVLDPKFEDNIRGALANNLKVGVYFYSYAKNVNEAKRQARWVVQNIKNYDISLPVAFDWENWDKYSSFGIGFRTLNHIAVSFIDEIKRYQYQSILYSSKLYFDYVWDKNYYDGWIAYYHKDYLSYSDYFMWQVCNDGKVDGIDGDVDIDVLMIK